MPKRRLLDWLMVKCAGIHSKQPLNVAQLFLSGAFRYTIIAMPRIILACWLRILKIVVPWLAFKLGKAEITFFSEANRAQ